MEKEIVTLEKMIEIATQSSDELAIIWAQDQQRTTSLKVSKPYFDEDCDSKELEGIIKELKEYEIAEENYRIESLKAKKVNTEIDKIIKDFIFLRTDLNQIPKEYQEKIYELVPKNTFYNKPSDLYDRTHFVAQLILKIKNHK